MPENISRGRIESHEISRNIAAEKQFTRRAEQPGKRIAGTSPIVTPANTAARENIGENPFSLAGGVGAVWIRSREAAGTIRLHARHPSLGEKTVEIRVKAAEAGQV